MINLNILVTGGAGYIGSHTIIELLKVGHSVVVVDNFCNSSEESINRIEKITGIVIPVYKVDIRDRWNCQEMCSRRIPKILDRQESGGVMSQLG